MLMACACCMLECMLTLSPLCVCLNDPVNIGWVLESLPLALPDLLRVPSLVLSEQVEVQHHRSLQEKNGPASLYICVLQVCMLNCRAPVCTFVCTSVCTPVSTLDVCASYMHVHGCVMAGQLGHE